MVKKLLSCGAATGLVAAVLLSITGVGSAHAQTGSPTVVVSGLNNPRQLSMTTKGELLIAEAGNGGTTRFGKGKHAQFVGTSGSVSLVPDPTTAANEAPNRVLTGFLSEASGNGIGAVGSDGVSGQSRGSVYVIETFAPVTLPPFFPNQLGQLFVAHTRGLPSSVANISAFNQTADPDGQPFDSDPYAVLVTSDNTELVADAASNDIVSVKNGTPSVFHVFPNVTTGKCAKISDPNPSFPGCNFVPTALAQNRAGDIFVTGLVSEVRGAGLVVELDPTGATVLQTWSGFSSPDGIAVDRAGNIYVSQLEAPEANPESPMITGVLTEIPVSGAPVNTDVPFPAGLVISGGNLYVSAFSIAPAGGLGFPGTSGQVWRMSTASSD
jgi:hypothetical protein